jgi:hypothetical protein
MRARIALAPILQETVPTPYCNLVTRSTGAAVRSRIEALISDHAHPTTQLDFSSINLLDYSCADEVVAKLIMSDAGDRPRFVVLLGLSDAHGEALDHVLERHGITVAAVRADEPEPFLLGWKTPDLITAFTAVQRVGPGDAGRVADHLSWTVERAADALQCLSLRGVLQAAGGTFRPLPTI